jgi:hypothetical protein
LLNKAAECFGKELEGHLSGYMGEVRCMTAFHYNSTKARAFLNHAVPIDPLIAPSAEKVAWRPVKMAINSKSRWLTLRQSVYSLTVFSKVAKKYPGSGPSFSPVVAAFACVVEKSLRITHNTFLGLESNECDMPFRCAVFLFQMRKDPDDALENVVNTPEFHLPANEFELANV